MPKIDPTELQINLAWYVAPMTHLRLQPCSRFCIIRRKALGNGETTASRYLLCSPNNIEADLTSQFRYTSAAAMHAGKFSLAAPPGQLGCGCRGWNVRRATCCVPGCNSNSTKHRCMGFHSFTKDRHLGVPMDSQNSPKR